VALYHVYRSQTFGEVVGQDSIIQTLKNSLISGRVSHAYLFSGSRGIGKTSTARILAKAVNCLQRSADAFEPCNVCDSCLAIAEGRAMDLLEIDAASNRGIDEIRSLKEKVNYAPTQLKYKVYIIDEVHMLTNEAFNALLKTLEEPPENTLFILATTEAYKVPETVISRCIRFDFRRISTQAMVTHLAEISEKEGIQADKRSLQLIAKQSQGGLRDALGLLEQLHSYGAELTIEQVQTILGVADRGFVEEYLDAIWEGNEGNVLDVIQKTVASGFDLVQLTDTIIEYFREILLYKVSGKAQLLDFTDEQEEKVKQYCQHWGVQELLRLSDIFLASKQNYRSSPLPELPLELAGLEAILSLRKPPEVVVAKPIQEIQTSQRVAQVPATQIAPVIQQSQSFPVKPVSVSASAEVKPVHSSVSTGNQQVATSEHSAPQVAPSFSSNASPDGAMALKSLLDRWSDVLFHVRKKNQASLEALLRSCAPIDVQGTNVIIAARYAFHKDRLSEAANKRVVEDVLSLILGVQVSLVVEVRSDVTPVSLLKNSASQSKPKPDMQEKVKEILDVFGGGTVVE